jgi:hypothetical protein
MTSKKITIDDLAIMVQKGFVDLEGGLSKKNSEFEY